MPAHSEAMKVVVKSSRIVKPSYNGDPPPATLYVPLSVFDKVTYNTHIAVLYAFRAPVPSIPTIEAGLATALSEYREWAGRISKDSNKNPVILLNDKGVRFIEATVDASLESVMPFKPSPALLSFHPSLDGVEELVQVQLTRFGCGSMVLGFTAHHWVADGHATSNFLLAWGLASRGLDLMDLMPLHDRVGLFECAPQGRVEFEHRGVEFRAAGPKIFGGGMEEEEENVVVHKVHFTKELLVKLKGKACSGGGSGRVSTTFESLVAHLWRVMTKARGLKGHEVTQVRISVNGRTRMRPRIPNEYFGNLVLWAFPRATADELLSRPLSHAVTLIHDAVVAMDGHYFRSFIDFASSGAVEREGLIPTAEMGKSSALCPNLEVDSWLRFPFYDLDFGTGCPYYFMPAYFPVEGMLFLLPSFVGDGSIDAFVPLFQRNLLSFKQSCYSLE